MTHRIAHLAAPEVASALPPAPSPLLPMGSLETHGPALPMGDYLVAEDIAERIASAALIQGADALVAPRFPFGGEDFFAGVAGGIAVGGDADRGDRGRWPRPSSASVRGGS